jgi:hypothetical protein
MGDPAMTTYLDGPESDKKMEARHAKFLELLVFGKGQMFKIGDATSGEIMGGVGSWESEWRGETVYGTGWGRARPFPGEWCCASGYRAGHRGGASGGEASVPACVPPG